MESWKEHIGGILSVAENRNPCVADISGKIGHVNAQFRKGFAEISLHCHLKIFYRFLEVVSERGKSIERRNGVRERHGLVDLDRYHLSHSTSENWVQIQAILSITQSMDSYIRQVLNMAVSAAPIHKYHFMAVRV